MFVGIDPEGLAGLARTLDEACLRLRHISAAGRHLAERNGVVSQTLDALFVTMRWGETASRELRWRAGTIRTGQATRFNIVALLRAEYAATGVFAPEDRESAFSAWLQDRADSRHRADAATDRIGDWLHQGWLDWDVTNADLHRIRAELEALTGRELDRVIAALTSRQLERWVAEMGHSLNGFSREEKRQVFALLATNVSGGSLQRIHEAVLVAGDEKDLIDLGEAIRDHSSDLAISDFVAAVVTGELNSHRFSTLAPGLAFQGLDDAALAAESAAAVLNDRDALSLLVADALAAGRQPDTLVSPLLGATDATATSFADLLTLLATPRALDELISSRHPIPAGDRPGRPHELVAETEEQLLVAATDLLAHNPDAVFAHLATTADSNGDLTSHFWHLLVARGDAEAISVIVTALAGADGVDLAGFATPGDDPEYDYPHARNLAFAAATLNRGFTAAARDAHRDIEAIGRVAGVAIAVSGLSSSGSALTEGAVGTGAGWGIDAVADDAKADIDEQLAALIDTATARLRPTDGVDLNDFPGAANAMLAWTSVYTRMLPFA